VIQILNFGCGGCPTNGLTNMIIKKIAGLMLLLCLSGAVLSIAVAAPQASKQQAPRDPKIIDAQGYQELVAQYRGKPLLVTFWATWCEPCRDEYPMLNELAKQYAPQGLHVVGVNLDDDGDLILMRRFMARYKPVFPNYRKKKGGESDFVNAVLPGWNGAIPASVFYAKDGRQIGHLLGENNRDTYEAAIRMVLSSGDGTSASSR
jgi:thiol-disulfide isomerase/thioredoxin